MQLFVGESVEGSLEEHETLVRHPRGASPRTGGAEKCRGVGHPPDRSEPSLVVEGFRVNPE
jgi:hypothetical protein